jgi:peroxiredoxin
MAYLKTNSKENGNSIKLYYEDYGKGKPVILIHGWPLSHRMWDKQISDLVEAGYRVITYDRRGFGQSSKPYAGYDYNTLAKDLKALISKLKLKEVTLIGFSMGGGEVARYIGNYGTSHVKKAILVGAVTPYLLQTEDNDNAVDGSVFESMKEGIAKDRPAFFEAFGKNFVSYEDLKEHVSLEQIKLNWNIAMSASRKATLDCVDAFGLTDFREDLKKFDIPTLVIHGDNDRIVPLEVSGKKAMDFLKHGELKVIKNGSHGLSFTHAEELSESILNFLS